MRGILVGLVLLPAIVLTTLSFRPGGLRNALRNVVRRLKLALVLAGIYLLGSSALKLALAERPVADYAIAGLALVLALVFIFQSRDRQLPG